MGGEPKQPAGPGAPGTDAFDLWLRQSLRQLHGAVVNEPVPAELLRIIEDDRTRRADP